MSTDYKSKKEEYFSNIRIDMISLIPKNPSGKILEVGAGAGDTLVKIKELNLAQEVAGLELMSINNSNQTHSYIDKFVFGNIEEIEIPFPENYFDVVICADVLEHLVDPWKTVKKIAKHLKTGGSFLISVPNITDILTMYKIFIKKDFAYSNEGILDKTHLRFFCKKNVSELFDRNEFKVETVIPSFKVNPAQSSRRKANKLSFGLLEEYLTVQYIVVGKKI